MVSRKTPKRARKARSTLRKKVVTPRPARRATTTRPKGTPKTGGRTKGTLNKATVEAKAMARKLLERPKYLKQTMKRLDAGELPTGIEQMLWYYLFGKPKEQLESHYTGTLEVTWKS